MASLDNFHTGNGGVWRDRLYLSENQYMNTIGLGLPSPDRWDLTTRVPIPNPLLDPGRHQRQLPRPSTIENKDARVNDLYVPVASHGVQLLRGDNAESMLLYDKAIRHHQCPFRRWLKMGRGSMCSVRYHPY